MPFLDVPDATLYYEVRGTGPLVALVGSPVHAGSFAPLADLLAVDHTVLTTDPRGIHRSRLHDPEQESTPQRRADDLARLLDAVDAGPAAVFGSSGGAVTALALAQTRPELAHTVIAHEPPLDELLDDRDELRATQQKMIDAYRSGDPLAAWTIFVTSADIPVPPEMMVATEPQQIADERRWFLHEMAATTSWVPDLDALRAGPALVVGIGRDSAGEECDRTSRALAALLDIERHRCAGYSPADPGRPRFAGLSEMREHSEGPGCGPPGWPRDRACG